VLAGLPTDRELAVVALLREAVLEHHHRADDLLSLDVRDVEALDPDRQRLEVEDLAELLERLDTPQPLRLRHERLRRQRELGVPLRELLQPPLLAALGRAHLDPRAAQLGQEAFERAQVAQAARHEDLRRDRRRRTVVLEAEPLEDLEWVVV